MTPVLSCREAIRETLAARMSGEPRMFLMGEDIGLYGGAFGVTRGLIDRFPGQIIETPISENSFVGIALGASMGGYRPVVEIMFMDFVTLAMDQIVNHAAKMHYMYAGQITTPLVIRMACGGGRGYGASHSQSLEGWFVQVPGLVVLYPSTPEDMKGLLNSALDENSPVIFLENKMLYDTKGPVSSEDFRIPIGQARVTGAGDDLTIVTYGRMAYLSQEVREILGNFGISVEVIDLRSLKPLDHECIVASVEKTGRLAIVTEASPLAGVGAEIAALAAEKCFDYLRAPIFRSSLPDIPIPAATSLEKAIFPDAPGLVENLIDFFFTP